jgi:hypothetical protein
MAMLVPTVWRMECGLIGFVIPEARTYFFTMFWTERVVRGLSLPTREAMSGLRVSVKEVKLPNDAAAGNHDSAKLYYVSLIGRNPRAPRSSTESLVLHAED